MLDYRSIRDQFQSIVDEKNDRFYPDLLLIVAKLEDTNDVKVLKVISRFKMLLKEKGNPFNIRLWKMDRPQVRDEIMELTVKLIDFLNDHFEFLKPLK